MAKPVAQKLADTLQGVAEDAAVKLQKDLDQTVNDARDAVSEAAAALAEAAQALTAQAREQGRVISREARARAEAAAAIAQEDIRDHPLTAIGCALGVGLVLGLLVARRN